MTKSALGLAQKLSQMQSSSVDMSNHQGSRIDFLNFNPMNKLLFSLSLLNALAVWLHGLGKPFGLPR